MRLVSLQGPLEGADGGGVDQGNGRGQEGRIEIVGFESLVGQGGFQVFEGTTNMSFRDFGYGFAPKVANNTCMVVGVNLFGACGGSEQARRSVKPLAFGLNGISLAGRMLFHLLFKGGHEVPDDGLIFHRDYRTKHRYASIRLPRTG